MNSPEHSLFFVTQADEKTVVFSMDERHHALSVLRKDRSGIIHATDGRGNIYACSLREDTAEARVIAVRAQPALMPKVHAFVGIPERDAFEEAVTKLAVLGTAKITPMICQYCQNTWWEAWEKHGARCHKKMVAGIKQSLNAWLPELTGPLERKESLEIAQSYGHKQCFVADADGVPFRHAVDGTYTLTNVACFIGPPGGFSRKEKDEFKALGYGFVKIAHTRLRTELAAVILCAQVMQI